ncbi:MAG: transcriptional repressor NrdR [Acidimicrobiia bacterium]|nr:transcriptional repressor NrdR [Acidimicrobiia bacterium]
MRCPTCAHFDDKVVDSRQSDDGEAVRRRRECLACGARFTTFERLELVPMVVVKRSGDRVPFEQNKINEGIAAAAKGRPIEEETILLTAAAIAEELRLVGPEVTSEQVGFAVLEHLRDLDHVAYMRFVSVYKGFDDAADFQREITLLTKATEPKRHDSRA